MEIAVVGIEDSDLFTSLICYIWMTVSDVADVVDTVRYEFPSSSTMYWRSARTIFNGSSLKNS